MTVPRQSLVLLNGFTIATAPPPPPSNAAPTVNAGPDAAATLPGASLALTGSVTDDGLPAGNALVIQWSRLSGPAAVAFGTPNVSSTSATFTVAGTYELELRASDGEKTSADTMVVTVNRPVNVPPTVNAGLDVAITLPTTTASLSGVVTDDGNPGTQALTVAWTKVSGPGAVVFANAATAVTTATITVAGSYELRLTADDGEATASDTVTVIVNPPPNTPPTVDAGRDTAITLPVNQVSLVGTASDDGLPAGSTLTLSWTKASGPGVVEFATPSLAATSAVFGSAGVYELRLTASDGDASASDAVVVTVNPAPTPTNQAPVVTATATPTAMTLPTNTVRWRRRRSTTASRRRR